MPIVKYLYITNGIMIIYIMHVILWLNYNIVYLFNKLQKFYKINIKEIR